MKEPFCNATCRNSLRLQLAPNPTVTKHVDGAWWPQSSQLTDELSELVTDLTDRLGEVLMVGYHRSAWPQTPAQIQVNGQTIELVGFTGDQPASVILVGKDGRHISLSVIPPDTAPQRAEQLLHESARGHPETVDAITGSPLVT